LAVAAIIIKDSSSINTHGKREVRIGGVVADLHKQSDGIRLSLISSQMKGGVSIMTPISNGSTTVKQEQSHNLR